jgi:MFS family permease
VPLFLQQVRGYGAFDTGLILLPQAIAAAVCMPIGGQLFDRIGARPLVLGGSALLAIASYRLTMASNTTVGTDLIVPLALYGAGMGLMMMPMNTQVINAAPRRLVSRVTSLIGALQQVITSLTIAAMSTILTSRPSYQEASAGLARLATRAGQAPAHLPPAIGRLFSLSFAATFAVMAAAAILGAALGALLRRRTAAQEADGADQMVAEAPVELEWELLAG